MSMGEYEYEELINEQIITVSFDYPSGDKTYVLENPTMGVSACIGIH